MAQGKQAAERWLAELIADMAVFQVVLGTVLATHFRNRTDGTAELRKLERAVLKTFDQPSRGESLKAQQEQKELTKLRAKLFFESIETGLGKTPRKNPRRKPR